MNGNARIATGAMLAASMLLGGCATTSEGDPLESYNRMMFDVNDVVDRTVLKPVARGYKNTMPEIVDRGISNFFSNIGDVVVAANNLLQGKVEAGLNDASRVLINSTVGLLGLVDVASDAGLQKHDEDFGQTLATWGVGSGPPVVLPLLGPSNVRDAAGLVVDSGLNAVTYVDGGEARAGFIAARVVDERADALKASSIFDEASFGVDRYAIAQDAYEQRREFLINDEDY